MNPGDTAPIEKVAEKAALAPDEPASGPARVGILLALITAATLVAYKSSSSLGALAKVEQSGGLSPKVGWLGSEGLPPVVRPLVEALDYMGWVLVALSFGIVLGAAVKAFVPRRWLMASVGAGGARGQLLAAAIGAPLMLCSCCAAPVFEGVYDRTKRLGPALALMIASPALNPATLVLTALLFPARLAVARVVLSLLLVLAGTALLGRRFAGTAAEAEPSACLVALEPSTWPALGRAFGAALREIAARSLPAILLGVLVSAVLAGLLPLPNVVTGGAGAGPALVIVAIAAVAIPIAMPTFAELPIGLALLAAGAPEGAVLAILVAGPAINLPSLLTVRKVVSAPAALATAFGVFALSAAGGLLATLG